MTPKSRLKLAYPCVLLFLVCLVAGGFMFGRLTAPKPVIPTVPELAAALPAAKPLTELEIALCAQAVHEANRRAVIIRRIDGLYMGSGVMLDNDHVYTAAHVVKGQLAYGLTHIDVRQAHGAWLIAATMVGQPIMTGEAASRSLQMLKSNDTKKAKAAVLAPTAAYAEHTDQTLFRLRATPSGNLGNVKLIPRDDRPKYAVLASSRQGVARVGNVLALGETGLKFEPSPVFGDSGSGIFDCMSRLIGVAKSMVDPLVWSQSQKDSKKEPMLGAYRGGFAVPPSAMHAFLKQRWRNYGKPLAEQAPH